MMMMMLLPRKMREPQTLVTVLVAWALLLLRDVRMTSAFRHKLDKCEPIGIPRCRTMAYNMTRMPNLLHHSTQENARLSFESFHVLLDRNCSDVLLFLLCAMYVPICTVAFQPEPIPPCRSVCERARAGCEPLMNVYNVSWPEALNCSRLPRYERGVCVSPEAIVSPSPTNTKQCKCKKKQTRVKRMFRKHKYDYAIHAVVTGRKRVDATTTTIKVQITEVLYCGQVKFPRSNHVTLWTNSSCACPSVQAGRHYLLAGQEDVTNGRFLLSPLTGLAIGWREKWGPRVKRWYQRIQQNKGRKPHKGSKFRKRGKTAKDAGKSKSPTGPKEETSRHRATEHRTGLLNTNLTRR